MIRLNDVEYVMSTWYDYCIDLSRCAFHVIVWKVPQVRGLICMIIQTVVYAYA